MVPRLDLRLLDAAPRYRSPFDESVSGFNPSYWGGPWRDGAWRDALAFTIEDGRGEVARAAVLEHAPGDRYVDLPTLRDPVELALFEVVAERRGTGVGSEALRLVAAYFARRDLWAHVDAPRFYDRNGWTTYERADGLRNAPLYVLQT